VLARLSLRARLIITVIALVAIGLVAADFATYSSLRSFLVQRTDNSLQQAHLAAERALNPPREESDHGPAPQLGRLLSSAPGDYVQLRRLDGRVVTSGVVGLPPGTSAPAAPRWPTALHLPAAAGGDGDRVRYLTVSAAGGDDRYRLRASIEQRAPNYILLLAASLHDVDSTLHRLLLIELLVTALVLSGIAAVGLWVVRLSLRPLDAIGATAAAIAGGDLTRRIERAEDKTEVGRLGLALNAMLSQIESSFKAREASERKLRRFVADASHELRTPLAAVRAYAELFTRGAASRPVDLARSMTGIRRESERMSLLVDDLLLLARLDEGRPLERDLVALDEVVHDAVETARTLDPERQLDVDLEAAAVVGDRDRLRQIVDNLLSNVRAHTPPRTPVRVSIDRVNGNARVTVADRGPGMTAEQAEHVFERFYRTDASRTRASGGVGLGLSIVAAVAEAQGGTVAVESAVGRGTSFHIDLPLAADGDRLSEELQPAHRIVHSRFSAGSQSALSDAPYRSGHDYSGE
jgi:two-component system OmpR family sensor kinase